MTGPTHTPADAREDDAATADTPSTPDARDGAPEAPSGDVAALRREAAGYRRRLRDAERERDALAERVNGMQRAEVERIATTGREGLADGRDFWTAAGVELADLLDDDGNVDAAKVGEARERVLSDRPHWRRPPTAADFDGGVRQEAPAGPDFASALRRAAGGGY